MMRTSARPEPPALDFVDLVMARWEQASPAQTRIREQEAMLRLMRMSGHLRREFDEIAAAQGLVAGPAQALLTLRWYDPEPATPKEVMAATNLTSGAVTAVLDKLEGRKLMQRHEDPADRRGTLLRITETGREAANRIIESQLARNERRLERLSAQERSTLARLLRKLSGGGASDAPPPQRDQRPPMATPSSGEQVFQALRVSEFD